MGAQDNQKIDRMADGFVGVGGHRDVPLFGFDPQRRLQPLPGIDARPDEDERRSASVGAAPSTPLEPSVGLPAAVRDLLGSG